MEDQSSSTDDSCQDIENFEDIDIKSEEEEDDGEEFEHYRAFKRSLSTSAEWLDCAKLRHAASVPPALSRQFSDSSLDVLKTLSTLNDSSMDGLAVMRIEKCPLSTPLDTNEDHTTASFAPGLLTGAPTGSVGGSSSSAPVYSSQTLRFWERYQRFFLLGKTGQKLPRPYICSTCHKKFHWLSSLIQHKLLHKGRQHSCGFSQQRSCSNIHRFSKQRKLNIVTL